MSRGKGRSRTSELTESWGSVSFGEEDLGQYSSLESDIPAHKLSSKSSARKNPSSQPSAGPPSSPAPRNPPRRTVSQTSVEPEFVMPSPDGSWAGSPQRSTPRPSRRPQAVVGEHDSTDMRQRKRKPMQRAPPPEDSSDSSSPLVSLWVNLLGPVISYFLSVLGFALNVLKPLISLALAVVLFAALLSFARSWLASSVSTALAPVCSIPGMSMLNLPFCEYYEKPAHAGSVEFDELVTAQEAFEDIISSSSKGEGIPADMKRSETAIRDLRTVVRFSALPSKHELEFEFNGFIDAAAQASFDLARFNMRIGTAVDKIVSTNRWTLQVIDEVANKESERSAVDRFVWDRLLWPIAPSISPHDKLVSQYLRHTQALEDQISQLIVQAEALLRVLDNLEDRLGAIHEISIRDDTSAKEKREELFLHLWTKLGGNRSDVKKLEAQIRLLKNVNMYRRTAVDHVSTTMIKLQAISASLEDMRERAAAPDITGADGEVPIHLHIENIQLGLERLEAQRIVQRQEQDETNRRILDGNDPFHEDRMIDGRG